MFRGLCCRDARACLDEVGIPGCGLAKRNRQHRLEPVNHIAPDQQRDAKAALFERNALQLVNHFNIDDIQD